MTTIPGLVAPSPVRPRPLSALGYVDVVDFVERTTYAIWNGRAPGQVRDCYPADGVIWNDAGDLVGAASVEADTRAALDGSPGYQGWILDTIATGSDDLGYRTSMRFLSREPAGRGEVWSSCVANCVVWDGRYVEEWGAADTTTYRGALGLPEAPLPAPSGAHWGEAGRRVTQGRGPQVPAVPDRVDGAGLLAAELVDRVYNGHDLSDLERRYAPGAPWCSGVTRWDTGPAGVEAVARRWFALLPDLTSSLEELYWVDDAPGRSRVALRHRLRGTLRTPAGERPVAVTAIHHLHVRGDLVVAEWAEWDRAALVAGSSAQSDELAGATGAGTEGEPR